MGIDNNKTVHVTTKTPINITHDVTVKIIQAQVDHSMPEPAPERPPAFTPMFHGKATDTIAQMSSRNAELNPITGNATIDRGEVRLVIEKFNDLKGSLGVNTHKLLCVAISNFTALNHYDKSTNNKLQLRINISLKEYASLLGYDVEEHPTETPEEAEKEKKRAKNALDNARKAIRKDLEILKASTLTWEEKIKGKAGDFDSVSIFGRAFIRQGVIMMEYSLSMGEYLAQLPITQYPLSLLSIDARNANAYSMGLKFTEHYNMDNNQKRGTANLLKVSTLIACTNLPTYDHIQRTDRGHWEERIKEPFENSLDVLKKCGCLKDWRYSYSKGVELTDAQATKITDFETFNNMLIYFELDNAIDHTERIEKQLQNKK